MIRLFKNRMFMSVFLSAITAFLFVFAVVQSSTTISTAISTGGTLTVSGATTLSGNVTLGDASTDINLFTGKLHASTTALFTSGATFYDTVTVSGAKGLVLGSAALDSSVTSGAGVIYYNTVDAVVRMHDGTSWFTVGTTTSGLALAGAQIKLSALATQYMTFGTTTQQGLSMLTLEATSTAAIPLTIVGRASQAANTFQIRDAGSANLLYVNSAGGLFGSSTAQFTNPLTTYGSDVLGDASADVLTVNGGTIAMGSKSTTTVPNARATAWSIATSTANTPIFTISTISSPLGKVGIGTTSPYHALGVTGTTTSSAGMFIGSVGSGISALLFGTCAYTPGVAITASTTKSTNCTSATGVISTDRVFVTPRNLDANLIFVSASSTADDVIQVSVFNTGIATGTFQPTPATWDWMVIR